MSKTGIALDKTFSAINGVANAFNDLKEKITEAPRAVVATIGFTALTGVGMASPAMAKPAGVEAPAPAGHANRTNTGTDANLEAYTATFNASVTKLTNETKPDGKKWTEAEAKFIATTNANNFFKDVKAKEAAETLLQKDISPEVEAQLNAAGLSKEDVTPVTDISAEVAGPHETGNRSLNKGNQVTTPLSGLEQSQNLLNAKGGFTESDRDVAFASLESAHVPAEVRNALAKGEFAKYKIEANMFTLKSKNANYRDITFNNNGKLDVAGLRAVGANDALGVVTYEVNGQKGSYIGRFDCSGAFFIQVFKSVEIPKVTPVTPVAHPAKPVKPTAPAKPARPVVKPPVTVPSTSTTTTTEAPTTTVPGSSTSTTIRVTTTATTMTIPVTTIPVTTSTTETHPPKTCENNPEICETTTAPTTTPDTTADTRPHSTVANNSESAPTTIAERVGDAGKHILAAIQAPVINKDFWNGGTTSTAVLLGGMGIAVTGSRSNKKKKLAANS